MAVVKIYIGPDGSDANDGSTRALRIQGRTRLLALVDALGAGDTVRIMAEGVFHRNITGWATANHYFDLDGTAHPKLEGFRLSATNTEDGDAPLPEWCSYAWLTGAWTDTTTTTTLGTKIWSKAVTTGSSGVHRLWAADSLTDADYWRKEMWEGGANYTTTFTNIHPNLDWIPGLDTYGPCWTCYKADGTLSTTLIYMASPIDPGTLFPTITYLTSGQTETLRIINLSNWTVDPEITLRGGSARAVTMETVGADGECQMHAACLGGSQYGVGYSLYGVVTNLTIGPYYDPLYPYEVPVYCSTSTGHNTSGHHGVNFDAACDQATADGFWDTPGVTTYGVRIKATSTRSNSTDRVNVIRDCFHGGVSGASPTGGVYRQYVSIDDGMQFDFRNVKYGRAFAFTGTANARYIKVGAILAHNMPTPCQLFAYRSSWIGGRVHGKAGVGNDYVSPYGLAIDKGNADTGFLAQTGTGGQNFSDLDVHHCEFMCASGMAYLSVSGGVAMAGPVRMADNVAIRPWFQSAATYSPTFYQAVIYTVQTSADDAMLQMRNNVTVGYPSSCARRYVISPSSNASSTPEAALPAATNSGWTHFSDFESYQQAKRVGQIRA